MLSILPVLRPATAVCVFAVLLGAAPVTGHTERRRAPAPRPISIPYTLGAYYMPKPHDPSHQWAELWLHNQKSGIKPDGQRVPLLGYYPGDDPDVLDWQIKHAVEHGITYFVFDDYWTESRPTPTYEGSLNAFLRARYRDRMQFAVSLYANNTVDDAPAAKSRRFLTGILPYYVSRYLSRPNYLLVDGKPAIYIGNLGAFGAIPAQDFAAILAEADAYVRAHTKFSGVTWIAGDPGHDAARPIAFGHVKACGFRAVAPYYVLPGIYPIAPYDTERACPGFPVIVKPDVNLEWGPGVSWNEAVPDIVERHAASLREAAASGMGFIPSVTLDFDSRWVWWQPRHLYFAGQNVEGYRTLLTSVRDLVDRNRGAVPIATRTGKPMVGLGAWNEWGESSSIEPGWAALNAAGSTDPFLAVKTIAQVFGGPREYRETLPPDYSPGWPAVTDWRFSSRTGKGPEKWLDVMAISSLRVGSGDVGALTIDGPGYTALTAVTGADTRRYGRVKVLLAVDQGGPLKTLILRWQSTEYYDKAARFGSPPEPGRKVHDSLAEAGKPVRTADGFDEYTFDLSTREDWRGRLRCIELRIGGTTRPAKVRIRRVWLGP